jgi:hypothetical protein
MHPEPEYVGIPGAKTLSGLGRSTLFELAARGEVRAVKAGRRTLFEIASLRVWLAARPTAVLRPRQRRSTRITA